MDVIKVVQVLLRRWFVVLPVLLLGGAVTAYSVTNIPDEYSLTASVIVADQTGGAGETSPGILAEALQDGETRAEVERAAGSGLYSVQADGDGILRVSATGDDQAEAVATANAVLDQMAVVLQERAEAAGREAPTGELEVLNRATGASVVEGEGAVTASASARYIETAGGSLGGERATRLLAQALMTTTVRQEVVEGGGVSTYALSTSRDLPTLGINITGTDEEAVLATVGLLIEQANAQLDSLSAVAGAQPGTVSVEPLVMPEGVLVDSTGVFRSMVALLALTAGVGVAAAFAAESLVEYRRRPRSGAPSAARPEGERAGRRSATAPHDAPSSEVPDDDLRARPAERETPSALEVRDPGGAPGARDLPRGRSAGGVAEQELGDYDPFPVSTRSTADPTSFRTGTR